MHFSWNLQRHPIGYRAALASFVLLLSSIALSGAFALLIPDGALGCSSRTSVDFIAVPRIEVSCTGYPAVVQDTLNIFLNLAPMSLFLIILGTGVLIVLMTGGSVGYSVGQLVLLFSISATLLSLNVLALLYAFHLVSRLRSSGAYRRLVGWGDRG